MTCTDSAGTDDSAATTDQGAATTDTGPPVPGESAATWTDDDEKRFAEVSKHLTPELKKQVLDVMKPMNRADRDAEFSSYEKMQHEETEKARKDQDTKSKSTTDKTGQGKEARPSKATVRSQPKIAQPPAVAVIMLEPVR